MSTPKDSKRFTQAGVYVIDNEKRRRAGFPTVQDARDTAAFMNSGNAHIEDYIWEDAA